jgi:hypothetical protein
MITQKCRNFNILIILSFSKAFLVSFGIFWKNLTLTGTIWAQFYGTQTIYNPSAILTVWTAATARSRLLKDLNGRQNAARIRGDPKPKLKGRVKTLDLSEPPSGEQIAALTIEAIYRQKLHF